MLVLNFTFLRIESWNYNVDLLLWCTLLQRHVPYTTDDLHFKCCILVRWIHCFQHESTYFLVHFEKHYAQICFIVFSWAATVIFASVLPASEDDRWDMRAISFPIRIWCIFLCIISAVDLKQATSRVNEETPEISGSFLYSAATVLLVFSIFYNVLFLTVIKPSIDGGKWVFATSDTEAGQETILQQSSSSPEIPAFPWKCTFEWLNEIKVLDWPLMYVYSQLWILVIFLICSH